MDLLRKYLVPLYQAPDEAAVAADPASDPPVAADPPVVADDGDPVADPTPAPAPRAPVPDAVISTITGLRAKNREFEQQLQEANRRARDAQELADRLARGDGTDPGTRTQPPAADQPADVNQLIDQRADYKLFLRDVQTMRQAGMKQYGTTFQGVINALDSVGAADDNFIQQVMAVDPTNAHTLLNELGQDLEKTVSLVNMSPAQRIAELTRMSMAAAPAPKTEPAPAPAAKSPAVSDAGRTLANARSGVSKAPPPAPAVTPSASKSVDWRSDEASDAEFSRGWDESQRQKISAARGR